MLAENGDQSNPDFPQSLSHLLTTDHFPNQDHEDRKTSNIVRVTALVGLQMGGMFGFAAGKITPDFSAPYPGRMSSLSDSPLLLVWQSEFYLEAAWDVSEF
jgi:hypothetical protein